jgi:quercetin dioxygenase-like cupin family protein
MAEKAPHMKGKPLRIHDIVDFQSGSIVSSQLLEKETGTITLFAFDAGEGLSEHTTPFDAFLYVFEGEAEITIAGTAHRVSEGELIIMPADKPHSVKAYKRFKMMLVMIKQ